MSHDKKNKKKNKKNLIFLFFYYFFNVMASGGLYSLIYNLHHNSQSFLITIFVHWTQLLEYWSHIIPVYTSVKITPILQR